MDLLPVAEAIKQRTGRDYHRITIYHWQTKGIKAGDKVIKLQSVFVGGARFTTLEWVDEFVQAVTAARLSRILKRKPSKLRVSR